MARSLHTDPPQIRAARRAAAPHVPRSDSAAALRREAQLLAVLGLRGDVLAPASTSAPTSVRIRVAPPRTGFIHPATMHEIRDLLRFFGPLTTYGIRSIELRHRTHAQPGALLVATLQVPGLLVIYEQPSPPWSLPGRLSAGALDVLDTAGAVVELAPAATRVHWPGTTLRDFVLFDGLMHEIGHHIVQHHGGKRTARVMRTADHERRAQAFAHACRAAWTTREQQA